MFRGRYEHSVDDKGRLAVPAKFREVLGQTDGSEINIVVTNFDRCLVAYSMREWEALECKIAALPQFDPRILAFQRYFISAAVECAIDRSGRVLLPANLRNFAGISHECVLAGQLSKFEIWSAERWGEEFRALSDQFANLTKTMADFGVQL